MLSANTPIAKLRRSGAYILILCASGYLYSLAEHFQFDQVAGRIGPDAWPKLVLTLLIATCAWQIGRVMIFDSRASSRSSEEYAIDAEFVPEEHPHLAWLGITLTVVYAYILPALGFLVSTALYIGLVTYLGRYRRFGPLVLTSVIAPVVLVFVFMKVVYLSLPLGQGPFKILSLAVMKMLGIH